MKLPKAYALMAIRMKNDLVAEAEERSNWDRRNQWGEQYCVHGTNVGTWDGPDLMCGWCEDGASHYTVALHWAYTRWERDRRSIGLAIQDALLSWNAQQEKGQPQWAQALTYEESVTLGVTTLFLRGALKRELLDGGLRAAIQSTVDHQ